MVDRSAPMFFIPHDEAARQRQWAALERTPEPRVWQEHSEVRSAGFHRRASDNAVCEEAVRGLIEQLT